MFDTVFVSQSLLEKAIKDTDITLEYNEGYCDFQTKDLDNSLAYYYIDADGNFFWKKQEFKWVEKDPASDSKWDFGHMEPVGEAQMIEDTRTAYIDFYDVYSTDKERIFITFTAHVKCGKLVESLVIKNIERNDLKVEAVEHKIIKEKWNKVEATWQWRVASFISNIKWKLSKLFRPITHRIDKLEINLRQKARALHNLP